jgi:hypothetical protein
VALLTNTHITIVREVREQNPDRRRQLLYLPYNGAHFSAGIFTTQDKSKELPAILRLQKLLLIPGLIHVFYVKPELVESIRKVRDAVAYQDNYDPLRRFLANDQVNNVGLGNLKHPRLSPYFVGRQEIVYRDSAEARIMNAVGIYFDHVSCHTSKPYIGKACIIPIACTHNVSVGRYMQFEVSFALDESKEMAKLPKLKPGSSGYLVFCKEATYAEEDSWRFNVVEKSVVPGLSRIALYIFRAKSSTTANGWSERDPATTTLDEVRKMGPNFYHFAQSLPSIDVTLFTDDPNTKDVKRSLKAINSIGITKTDSETKIKSKKTGIEVVKGRNPHLLPQTKLWEKISPGIKSDVRKVAYEGPNCVKGEQRKIIEQMEKGIPGSLQAIAGGSGCGKTQVAQLVTAPYALEVKYNEDMEHDRLEARKQFNEYQLEILTRKLEIQQHALATSQGLGTNDLPEIALNEQDIETLDGLKPRNPRALEDGTFVVDGQVATLSAMNATVDHAFIRQETMIAEYAAATGLGPRLGVRVHSNNTESGMSLSFLNPLEKGQAQDDLFETELDITGNDVIAEITSNFKYKTQGRLIKGVRDKRVRNSKKSLAKRVLEVIGEETPTPEILAAFTLEEREAFEEEASPLVIRVIDNHVHGLPIGKELGKAFKRMMRKVYVAVLSRAHHIGCTIAMSMDTLVVTYCRFDALWVDEATKAFAASLFSHFGQHAHAELRMLTGDLHQMHGTLFGRDLDNPFKQTAAQSPMETYRKRRMGIPELKETRRYRHQDLVRLVQIANNDDSIKAAAGIFPEKGMHPLVQQVSDYTRQRYGKTGPVMLVNVQNATTHKAGTSVFSPECAVIAANIAQDLALNITNQPLVIMTNYHAMKGLIENMNEAKKRDFRRKKDSVKAKLIGKILVCTVDEYQGREGDIVVHAGAKESYKSFVYDYQHINVYLGRAQNYFIFVNDTTGISLHKDHSHPLVRFVQWAGHLRTLNVDSLTFLNNFESFDDVLAFHKLSPLHRNKPRASDSRTHTVMFTLDDFDNDDDDDEDEDKDDFDAFAKLTGNGGFTEDHPAIRANSENITNVGFGITSNGEAWVDPAFRDEQEAILADIIAKFKPVVTRESADSLALMLDNFHHGEIDEVAVLILELIADLHRLEPAPLVTKTQTFQSLEDENQKRLLQELSDSGVSAPILLRVLYAFDWNYLRASNFLLVVYVDEMTDAKFTGTQVQQAVFEHDTAPNAVRALLEDDARRNAGTAGSFIDDTDVSDDDSSNEDLDMNNDHVYGNISGRRSRILDVRRYTYQPRAYLRS